MAEDERPEFPGDFGRRGGMGAEGGGGGGGSDTAPPQDRPAPDKEAAVKKRRRLRRLQQQQVQRQPKRVKLPKKPPFGPTVTERVLSVAASSMERRGISLAALKKALFAKGYDVGRNNSRVNRTVRLLVQRGSLVRTSGTGASGSFRFNRTAVPRRKKVGTARRTVESRREKKAGTARRKVASKREKKAGAARRKVGSKREKKAGAARRKVAFKRVKKAGATRSKVASKRVKKAGATRRKVVSKRVKKVGAPGRRSPKRQTKPRRTAARPFKRHPSTFRPALCQAPVPPPAQQKQTPDNAGLLSAPVDQKEEGDPQMNKRPVGRPRKIRTQGLVEVDNSLVIDW
ncbi:histone H1.1-like [Leucoraja erinacea]|uniref:histone H1.1-like n=1 Tax=Leucoraja erinaceus TaxID=7782 RepID=UPI002458D7BE|nr:histone H1.1-like [Leucoraja erinacea]